MPKAPAATITLVSHTPDHPDGAIHRDDTVTFAITPPDAGVITIYGSSDVVLSVWALVRGDLDAVLAPSPAWLENPGPLHATAKLAESVRGKVRTLATCEFDIEW